MKDTGINSVIEGFNALPIADKEFTLDVLKKAFADAQRDSLSKRAKKAVESYKKKASKSGSLKDLYDDLEDA